MNPSGSLSLINPEDNLHQVFEAIEMHGWQGFAAHLPPDLSMFQEPSTVFEWLKTHTIQSLQNRVSVKELQSHSTHDCLLELFVLQCEILQPFKRGLVKLPFLEAARFVRHMQPVLDTICAMGGVDESGLMGILKDQGLKGVYVYGLYHWMEDQSSDLTTTMAAFDKALRWGQTVMDKAKVFPPPFL